MAAFQEEFKINSNDFDSNLNIGALLRQEQSYEEAKPYLVKALPCDRAILLCGISSLRWIWQWDRSKTLAKVWRN